MTAPRKRVPNQPLSALIDEAGWTNGQLARAVNRLGSASGLDLSYGESTVSYWRSGTTPRPKVQPLVLEALSTALGRPVTSVAAGFSPSSATASGERPENLVDLVRDDMDPSRRGVLAAGLYSATLAVPGFSELGDRLDRSRDDATAGRTVRIGPAEVATVRTMTTRIADILDELGAGHARPMAAAFLANTVMPWLTADAVSTVKADMQAAASDLVYLTGWMAMYERAHGLGQRYYVQALKLAGDAGDQLTYCRTLRGMALQASNLGNGPKALQFADSAAEAAPVAGPRLVAFLRGQQAHGAAMVGDQRTAFSRLAETEAALSRADGRNDAVGGYDQAAYHFHVSHVLAALSDLPGSIKALQQSNRFRAATERQGRVHAQGLLATRQWQHGHIEAAAATWSRFLDDYETLSTARGDEHFGTLRRHIAARPDVQVVHQLTERVRKVAKAKAA
ncbi:hypothetical protein ACIQF6_28040 [Kitasatospora sp. NPDC092948]|uniref:hypothetical protein n=1 Tax=Kitasatospora sp. NPDC092948 TaxID=3364088 RepID=UPI0038159F8A